MRGLHGSRRPLARPPHHEPPAPKPALHTLAEAEIASEIYSTAGHYDLLVKFYVDNDTDIGHFINEKVQVLPGIQDTLTIITFKAFGAS